MDELENIIGQPSGKTIENKAVLPPSRTIAQLICSFSNSEGGYIILGVLETPEKVDIKGLSEDFQAASITHKAIDLISPRPQIDYEYINFKNKKLFIIKVFKSSEVVSIEGKIYIRKGGNSILSNPSKIVFKPSGYNRIKEVNSLLNTNITNSTHSKTILIEHYQSILKLADDLKELLYPLSTNTPTPNQEGKILTRILFSSIVDNFETYLSGLLYEIYLAKPESLRSKEIVTIEEVLNCSDLQEFIKYWSNQKISKLQKGSVKGFIKENKQINGLGVIDGIKEDEIEKILQIRHLYSHRNGIVDEKFLQYYTGEFTLNSEHQMSIDEILDKLEYLATVTTDLDKNAIRKYDLAII